jgi:hypothetical protein
MMLQMSPGQMLRHEADLVIPARAAWQAIEI